MNFRYIVFILTLFFPCFLYSFFLEDISFNSDIPFSNEEFFYLTDLKSGTTVNEADVHNAYKNIVHKNIFSSVDTSITNGEKGKNVHFSMRGSWIFKKVLLKGIWFNSHKYTQRYMQHPGDVFDGTTHKESIDLIVQFLKEKGYFNASVHDELIYDQKHKTITVKLIIKKNKCFRVDNVACEFSGKDSISSEFKKRIQEHYVDPLQHMYYNHHKIKKAVEEIDNLLKIKGFHNYQVDVKRKIDEFRKAVSILFIVSVQEAVNITFNGNSILSDVELQKSVKTIDKSIWQLSPHIVAQHVLSIYRKHGYWNSKIKIKKQNSSYIFVITEGKATMIDEVIVKYKTAGTEDNRNVFFADVVERKIWNEEFFQKSVDKMTDFFVKQGFWDFEVLETYFAKKSGNVYSVTIVLEKGLQRFFTDVTCNEELNEAAKKFLIKDIKKDGNVPFGNVPFNKKLIEEQQLYLISYFQDKGYWYVSVKPELSFYSKVNEIKEKKVFTVVNWQVEKGPLVTFGKILLRGSTRLPFKRLIKSFEFKSGDLWDRKKLDASRKNIKKLDMFSFVQLQPYKLSKQTGEKPIVVSVLDDSPLEIRTRVGYFLTSKNFLFKRESTPKIGGSLILKNPFNVADKLIIDADYTKFEQHFVSQYRVPQLFGTSITGKTKAYTHRYVHPVAVGTSESAYEAFQDGFLFGIEKEYKPENYIGFVFGNEWMKTKRVRGNLNLSESMIDKSVPYFFLEPSLIRNNVDDHLEPTKGTISFASAKCMFPEKKGDTACRIQVEQSFFWPMKKVVGAVRIRLGLILRKRFNMVMPIERFYLGGPNTVRGYEKDALPPLGLNTTVNSLGEETESYTIQGGSSMMNGNFELRFPIVKSFGGVLFHDVGVLSQSGLSGLTEKWYPTSGFGFRYKTPIGALRFDIGWKWKRFVENESSYVWYLTLGHAF